MEITCLSDLHGHLPELPGGDLLIVAGDLTARDTLGEFIQFRTWLGYQPYKHTIVIGGNHDGCLQNGIFEWPSSPSWHRDFNYLQDSGCEYNGLKIWGSPWTPAFCNWYFMKHTPDELRAVWDLIPDDTDILITHGPMYGVLDNIGDGDDRPLGCVELRSAVERIKPKMHVCGHIHGGYGQVVLKHSGPNTLCVNAAIMDEYYRPVNKPIVVEI